MSGAAQLNAKAACKMNSLEHELLTLSSQSCTALCLTVKCQAFVLVQMQWYFSYVTDRPFVVLLSLKDFISPVMF